MISSSMDNFLCWGTYPGRSFRPPEPVETGRILAGNDRKRPELTGTDRFRHVPCNRIPAGFRRENSDDFPGYRKFANRNFANWTFAIGKRPLNFRQYTPWTFANTNCAVFRDIICLLALAKVHKTFANTLRGISPIIGESLIGEER